MNLLILFFLISSSIFLLSFLIGWFFIFNKNSTPELKSSYGLYLAVLMTVYLLTALFISICGLFLSDYILLSFLIFAIFPFLIGKVAVYKRLKFYFILQLFLILSSIEQSFFWLIVS